MEQIATLHTSEIIIQLPEELTTIVVNSGIDKAEQHAATFAPFMIAVKEFSNKAESLNKDQPGLLDAQIARQIRLAMVKNRSAADQAKDTRKAGLLAESNLIQNLFNVVVNTSKLVEADLTAIEKHAELKEQARQTAIKAERAEALAPYLPDPNIYPLGTMSDDAFETLLTGSRLALEQKQLAEQQAELERVRVENERLAEQERIKAENERLKKEAAERQQLQSVRLAAIRPHLLSNDQTDLSTLWQMDELDFAAFFEIKKQEYKEAARLQAEKDAKAEAERLVREAKLAEIEESNRLTREKAAQQQAENKRLADELQAKKDEEARVLAEHKQAEADKLKAIENRYTKRSSILRGLGLTYNIETQNFFNLHLSISSGLVKDIDDATFKAQLAGWKHHIEMAEEEMADILAKKKAEIEAEKAPERDRLKAWVESITLQTVTVESNEAIDISLLIGTKFTAFKTWALQQIEGL